MLVCFWIFAYLYSLLTENMSPLQHSGLHTASCKVTCSHQSIVASSNNDSIVFRGRSARTEW